MINAGETESVSFIHPSNETLLGEMYRQATAIRHLQFMNLRPFQDSFNQI